MIEPPSPLEVSLELAGFAKVHERDDGGLLVTRRPTPAERLLVERDGVGDIPALKRVAAEVAGGDGDPSRISQGTIQVQGSLEVPRGYCVLAAVGRQ